MLIEKAPKNTSPVRVLVVDDEPGIRLLLTRFLTGAGYAVDVASDGAHAWDMIHDHRYAALVLDLRMPGTGGVALYQRIKDAGELLAHRVVFITGSLISHNDGQLISASGNPLLQKPFDLAELEHKLQRVLTDGSSAADPPGHDMP